MINLQSRVLVLVLALLAALLGAVSSTTSAAVAGGPVIRMQVSHADAGRRLTPGELLQRMALRSRTRAARLLSGSSASAPVTPGQPSPEYLVHLGIGTPSAQPVQLVLDTGSDLVWTQCRPCTAASCFPQALPYFDPSLSSTFVNVTCGSPACQDLMPLSSCVAQTCTYNNYYYGDNSTTSGQLVADTFVFEAGGGGDQTAVPSVYFGCGLNNRLAFASNETGIAGFGRGKLSLPLQLGVDNFSYCFTSISGSTPSPVLLGLPANLYGGGGAVQTTPFIRSSFRPSFYYLNLQSITVGSTTLEVPASAFALNATDGAGGTVIDSGTSVTSLPLHVFSLLSDAFASQLNMAPVNVTSLPDFLCFPATTTVPTLQLQFDGGATLDLPQENYVFTLQDESNGQSNMCVAMTSTPGGLNLTIIGNYQQQNMHVLYDLAGNTLSFVPAHCDMV